ncbi:hypothetical protein ACA910_007670 [Epithemia clementina (nom. ined.)]
MVVAYPCHLVSEPALLAWADPCLVPSLIAGENVSNCKSNFSCQVTCRLNLTVLTALEKTSSKHDVLIKENNKLLVQLGLLKEDLDESEGNFAKVEHDLRSLELQTSKVTSKLNACHAANQRILLKKQSSQ